MSFSEQFRLGARATWSAGDWDGFSHMVKPVGALVLDRLGVQPGHRLLDVGTGSGANVAIPAAQLGAEVVGVDVTPELLEHARRRASEAGVSVEWIEADALQLPFAEESFDRVTSTFGAMFAPDHARSAAELVRVCRAGGRIAMTTWIAAGFVGGLFELTAEFLPTPPEGIQPPSLWGSEAHVLEMFAAAGVTPSLTREAVDFDFASVEDTVARYAEDFGPFVMAHAVLAPQGRWEDFLTAFGELARRFNLAEDGTAKIRSDYFVITIER